MVTERKASCWRLDVRFVALIETSTQRTLNGSSVPLYDVQKKRDLTPRSQVVRNVQWPSSVLTGANTSECLGLGKTIKI